MLAFQYVTIMYTIIAPNNNVDVSNCVEGLFPSSAITILCMNVLAQGLQPTLHFTTTFYLPFAM
jgi:hypothetical protein